MRIILAILVILSPAAVAAQPLTKASGGNWSSFPSLSADGRYTAYECSSGICRYDRTTNSATRVAAASGWALQWPKISGDGEHICYMAGSRVYLLDVSSGVVDSIDSGSHCDLSADGRYVVYSRSDSSTNVYLRDRQAATTTLISRNAQGDPAYGNLPAITPDGRYIVFESFDRLMPDDNNGANDIYLFDTATAAAERISVSSIGGATNGNSLYPDISSDGRYVVFRSWASNLVDNDNNACDDVFVRDRQTQTTELVSISSSGVQQDANNGWNSIPSISGDGSLVAFDSGATTLVPGDTNGFIGIFLRDRAAGTTREIDVPDAGGQADGEPFGSLHPAALSQDGGWLAFPSEAANLVSAAASRNASPTGLQIIYLANLNYLPPTPTPTPTPPDRLRPTVKASAAKGKAGKKINLTYTIADDSGVTKETIQILKGRAVAKKLKRKFAQIPESGQRTAAFKPSGAQRGKLKWCVTAADRAGNKSAKSCAGLRVQ